MNITLLYLLFILYPNFIKTLLSFGVKPGLRLFLLLLTWGLLCTVLSARLSDKDKVNFEEISYTKIVGRDL